MIFATLMLVGLHGQEIPLRKHYGKLLSCAASVAVVLEADGKPAASIQAAQKPYIDAAKHQVPTATDKDIADGIANVRWGFGLVAGSAGSERVIAEQRLHVASCKKQMAI